MPTRDVADWETAICKVVSEGGREEIVVRGAYNVRRSFAAIVAALCSVECSSRGLPGLNPAGFTIRLPAVCLLPACGPIVAPT